MIIAHKPGNAKSNQAEAMILSSQKHKLETKFKLNEQAPPKAKAPKLHGAPDTMMLSRNVAQGDTLETSKINTSTLNNQTQSDGRRLLIKNQLHMIEQLQLENANLRNERDHLHLENEDLKFQLQMIR